VRQCACQASAKDCCSADRAQCEYDLVRQLPGQGDVAGTGLPVAPGHRAVVHEILPAVTDPDMAGAGARECILVSGIAGQQGEPERSLFGPQDMAAVMPAGPGRVVAPGTSQMRGKQNVGVESCISLKAHLDQQYVAQRIGAYPQLQLEAGMAVGDRDCRHPGSGEMHPPGVETLDLHPEAPAVADDEAEVADLRDIDARIVHLVDDAVANGEPEPGWSKRTADEVLVAARPGGLDPRCTRCRCGRLIIHRHTSRVPGCSRQSRRRRSLPRRFPVPGCRATSRPLS
jgi:hypothetical protein